MLELERLRDARFIRPSLCDTNAALRVRAASCLGFLAEPEDLPRLERLVLKDPDRAVREAAAWGMSLSRGLAHKQLDHLLKP
jgi:HEAT repeat protein